MRNTNKRYLIYLWESNEIESFKDDMGIELCDALEAGRRDAADYGQFVDDTDSEDEAYSISAKKADEYSCSNAEVSIYDTVEHIWFN